MMRRIGIDVGGTNTDGVLLDGVDVLGSVKVPTTEQVGECVRECLHALIERTGAAPASISAVMIGTTHFINAVAERRHLARVACVRVCLPTCRSVAPMADWPDDLRELVQSGSYLLPGGVEYDGRPIAPFDHDAACRAADDIRLGGAEAIAITSVFSTLDPAPEDAAATIFREAVPSLPVSRSARLGRLGLLERENANILNAALLPLARRVVGGLVAAVAESGLAAPVYITQNDGTVTTARAAAEMPVLSFACGATNSMRGAAFLSGIADGVVIDVGGTTTDVGLLRNGFPREAGTRTLIGGVRTLFRAPQVLSLPIGGGTIVDLDSGAVGPRSVGHDLARRSQVFGGPVLTCTDIAVTAGRTDIGQRELVRSMPANAAENLLEAISGRIAKTVDEIKAERGDCIVIAVGGGAFLVPAEMEGASAVLRPPHSDVANAVGAAIAHVSGEVDRIFRNISRDEATALAIELARADCVNAGGDRDDLEVVDIEHVPLAYSAGDAIRIRARVVGRLSVEPGYSEAAP